MKRYALIGLLCLVPLSACAQTNVDRNPFPHMVSGTATRTQQVISTARPVIVGRSPRESKLIAHSSVTDKFIGNTVSGENFKVADITLDGNRYADSATNPVTAPVSDGVEMIGFFNRTENCVIEQFWGSAVVLRQGQICTDNIIENSFIGIEVISSDCLIRGNIVHGCRDYGIKVSGATGNVVSMHNHYYGHQRAGYVTGATYQAIGDMYADSSYGLYLETSGSRAQECTFQHNHTANIYVTGPGMILSDNLIEVQRVTNWTELANNTYGVYFTAGADASRFDGGIVNLTTYAHGLSTPTTDPVTGIFCAANQVYIDCNIHDNNSTGTVTKGLVISGAVNGVTFKIRTAGSPGFHDAGDQILVIDNAGADSIYGEIWIAGRTSKAINDYVTIPSGWDGTITVYDVDAGGAPTVLTGPTAY
jgi:parallel beta-helix repeat protein